MTEEQAQRHRARRGEVGRRDQNARAYGLNILPHADRDDRVECPACDGSGGRLFCDYCAGSGRISEADADIIAR